jgi:hypothetical protein
MSYIPLDMLVNPWTLPVDQQPRVYALSYLQSDDGCRQVWSHCVCIFAAPNEPRIRCWILGESLDCCSLCFLTRFKNKLTLSMMQRALSSGCLLLKSKHAHTNLRSIWATSIGLSLTRSSFRFAASVFVLFAIVDSLSSLIGPLCTRRPPECMASTSTSSQRNSERAFWQHARTRT